MDICKQLARNGLVHCDLNEFNLLVDLSGGAQRHNPEEDEDAGEFYVRHSGSSVSNFKGQLTVPIRNAEQSGPTMDGTGEIVTEEAPKPKEMLENGVDPKPVVTLIDFPQMVSVRHPNAKELWLRDIACLKRFFVMRLKMNMNEEDWERIVPEWEDLIANVDEEEIYIPNDDDDADGEKSVLSMASNLSISSNSCLASKKQLRLDQQLQASGFSKEDSERKKDLHYYEPVGGVLHEDEEFKEDENNSDEDGDNDDGNGDKVEEYDGEISDKEDDDDEEEVQVYRQRDHDDDNRSTTSNFSTLSRAESYAIAENKARERVRRHIAEMKKNKGKHNAYKKKNSNKTYEKGKRGFKDQM
jgi:hypothetical protein